MATVLTNEEHALYDGLKSVYNRVQNEAKVYEGDALYYLHDAVSHVQSVAGWIGRQWYWLMPLVYVAGYVTRWYAVK